MKRSDSKIGSFVFAAGLLTVALTAPAMADDDDMQEMRTIAKTANLITPEQAIEKALAAKPGAVLETDLDRTMKGLFYEIEIIDPEGVEWEVNINAKTGAVGKMKREWF